tara:strand:- start:963 stop:1562 length:600 start_codon:yes stop_codon:yes gene_type:complete
MIQFLTNYSDAEQSKLESMVELCLDAGVDCIQFSWNRDDVLYRLENIKKLTDKYNALLCINNNIALAEKFDADYIHIGPTDASVKEIKKRLPNIKIGFSIHPFYKLEELDYNVDYFGVGPVYKTITFKGHNKTFGLNKFKELVLNAKQPICAIGGINDETIKLIKETRCEDICISGHFYRSLDTLKTIQNVVKYWNETD